MLAAMIYVQYFIDSCFSKDFDEIFDWNGSFRIPLQRTKSVIGQRHDVGESWGIRNGEQWGMANSAIFCRRGKSH